MSRWRTLVRVDQITPRAIIVTLPGWHSDAPAVVARTRLPDDVNLRLGAADFSTAPYLHARVNLAAVLPGDLDFDDWEAR